MNTIFQDMIGKTMATIHGAVGKDEMIFHSTDGSTFKFYHERDCCETVDINDIYGDLNNLIGSPITMAEEVTDYQTTDTPECPDSFTWTFYKFATLKGYVTVRWLGESSGYYSESVSYEQS